MLQHRRVIFCLLAGLLSVSARAQAQTPATPPPVAFGAYASALPVAAAPAQLITLFVPGVARQLTGPVPARDTPLPTVLAGISVVLQQQSADILMPLLDVTPILTCPSGAQPPSGACGSIAAITVQIPPDIHVGDGAATPARVAVVENGVRGEFIEVVPATDQIHVLTFCDLIVSGQLQVRPRCVPLVTHAGGTLVLPNSPASGGETLVVWALGLGQTDPPLTAAVAASNPSHVTVPLNIDFNFHPNALPAHPLPPSASDALSHPLFAGAVQGFVGLYQINFRLPEIPQGIPPCAPTVAADPNVVQSNLTVSFGGPASFDGAALCVAPPPAQ